MECQRCLELQKVVRNMKYKLLEVKKRGEAPSSTKLNSELDAEVGLPFVDFLSVLSPQRSCNRASGEQVEALRCERDLLKAKVEMLQVMFMTCIYHSVVYLRGGASERVYSRVSMVLGT